MAKEVTWKNLVANPTLIGGVIESQMGGVILRSPISWIGDSADSIHISSPWGARLNNQTGGWIASGQNALFISKNDGPPSDIGDERICIVKPSGSVFTLFPKGASHIDTSSVKDLPKASARFLILYPKLGFDRNIVLKILEEKGFAWTHEKFSILQQDAGMQDLLNCFQQDSLAEEFLWHYVATVTGEQDVHQKVY